MTLHKNKKSNLTVIVIILIAISIGFGFLFDLVCEKIEYAVYKKPNDIQGFVTKYSEEYDVPEHLIYAMIKVESSFNPSAVSKVGAIGLMQMMPKTFEELTNNRLKDNYPQAMLYDPETSIRYGCYYIRFLYNIYGDWELSIAAYNAGPGNVSSWLESKEYNSNGDNKLDVIPFSETRNYVKKVIKAKAMYDKLYETNNVK